MATSVLMAATDNHHHQQPTNPSDHDQHVQPPIRRSSGRRKLKPGCDSSTGSKKKPPQRGMGVEKLERLRLQERWKKMTEINSTNPGFISINPPVNPVQVSKFPGFGAPNGTGQMGLNANPSYGLGFHGQMGLVPASDHHHQLQTDLFGIGSLNNSGFLGKNVSGISKELSSSPNVVKCYVPEHCNACHKKKKLVNGENLGSGRMITSSDRYSSQMCDVGDCGFLGLNMGDVNQSSIINQENLHGLRTTAPHVGYPVGNGKQSIEIVAVHRKGRGGSCGSEGTGDHVLMEYEFFPSSEKNDDNDLVMMKKMIVNGATGSETSSTMAGFDHATNCSIDLSLKLSSY